MWLVWTLLIGRTMALAFAYLYYAEFAAFYSRLIPSLCVVPPPSAGSLHISSLPSPEIIKQAINRLKSQYTVRPILREGRASVSMSCVFWILCTVTHTTVKLYHCSFLHCISEVELRQHTPVRAVLLFHKVWEFLLITHFFIGKLVMLLVLDFLKNLSKF